MLLGSVVFQMFLGIVLAWLHVEFSGVRGKLPSVRQQHTSLNGDGMPGPFHVHAVQLRSA